MKYIVLIASMFVVLGCQKTRVIEPVVPAGDRVVLLEEFTGKGCTNCPKGSREIDNLLSIYDTNLVVVSIHAGFFANPLFFPVGDYDMRTDEGEEIYSMLAPNSGYPSGVVDRVRVDGRFQIGANQWASVIQSELEREPEVEFTVEHEYIPESRTVTVGINGRAKVDLSNEVRVSVMLTESGIVDAQDDFEAGGIVDDYVHNHVLRTMGTPFNGEPVATNLPIAGTFEVAFDVALDSTWIPDNMEILVFCSENKGGGDFRVLQSAHVGLTH